MQASSTFERTRRRLIDPSRAQRGYQRRRPDMAASRLTRTSVLKSPHMTGDDGRHPRQRADPSGNQHHDPSRSASSRVTQHVD
jgi:hypothetical protein